MLSSHDREGSSILPMPTTLLSKQEPKKKVVNQMRKLIMWNVVTLDGYFEGKENWDLKHHELIWGPELEKISIDQLKSADALVFGKVTYEGMTKYWKNEQGTVANHMNSIRKIVCSTTLDQADWNNSTIVKNAVAAITKLKQEGNGNLFVFGSGILCASLMKANLFDEYRFVVAPVFLGNGRRLFNEGIPYQTLKLLQAKTLDNGGLILHYQPK